MQALSSDLYELNQERELATLSLGCNHESFEIWFSRCMADVTKDFGVLLNIKLDDQDRTLHLLRNADVLGCVSSDSTSPQGCVSFPLGKMIYRCVAHESFVARYQLSRQAKAKILSVPTVVFGPFDRLHDEFLATVFNESNPPAYNAHVIPSLGGLLDQVMNGSAYAVLPDALVGDSLRTGELVDLFKTQKKEVPLYWHRVQTSIPVLEKISAKVLKAAKAALPDA